jgi:chlorobactene glucosyltransferase
MIIFLILILCVLSLFCLVAAINVVCGPRLVVTPRPDPPVKVSVLVPARNEEKNIATCLKGLLHQDYPHVEIIVLDDQSSDHTPDIIRRCASHSNRITTLTGHDLPPGWTGKNYACHQLAQAATGDILIFTDADTRHDPAAITATVAYLQQTNVGLCSAFPRQFTVTFAEQLVLPVIHLFVYGGLPLWLTYLTPYPSLAAANGQWIAFTREAYHRIGGHESVRNRIVEDVELSRRAKRLGIKTLTMSGAALVSCRMYSSAREVWEGFSKNLSGLTNYRLAPFLLVLVLLLTCCVLPYILVWFPAYAEYAFIAIALNLFLRLLVSLCAGDRLTSSLLLHPFGILATVAIGLNSLFRAQRGIVRWKGRDISVEQ